MRTAISIRRLFLIRMFKQYESIPGEVWQCGVWHGGTAKHIAKNTKKTVRLFDSWKGLPQPCEKDNFHKKGDFSNVRFRDIKNTFRPLKHVYLHKGWIPQTFKGLEDSKIAFAHIDLNLYQSCLDALDFIYPRVSHGGILVFDDYEVETCKGSKLAVDEFFRGKEKISVYHNNHYIQKFSTPYLL